MSLKTGVGEIFIIIISARQKGGLTGAERCWDGGGECQEREIGGTVEEQRKRGVLQGRKRDGKDG